MLEFKFPHAVSLEELEALIIRLCRSFSKLKGTEWSCDGAEKALSWYSGDGVLVHLCHLPAL